jgi:Domain of unknown function (DUF5753)
MGALLSRHTPHELDQLVALRTRRQQALFEPENPLRLEVVLDEGILRRVVGSSQIMAEQLAVMSDRSALSNVTVQVLPFDAGFHRAHMGSFVLLEFPVGTGPDIIYVEGHAGESYLENRSDVERYRSILQDVISRALSPEASRELLAGYRRDYASQNDHEGSTG